MNEHHTPINVQWDLPAGRKWPNSLYRRWSDQLAGINAGSLTLRDATSPYSGSTAILENLSGSGIPVSLTVAGLAAVPDTLEPLLNLGVASLFLRVRSFGELREVMAELKSMRRRGTAVGISFTMNAYNFWDLPDIILFSRINGIAAVDLPVPHPGDDITFFPDRRDRSELFTSLRLTDMAGMSLSIADPFLRRLCCPGQQGLAGCGAGRTLIFISSAAEVFPCPSMPIRLGSLKEESLENILASGTRLKTIEQAAMLPESCRQCREAQACNGGCRGRAYTFHSSFRELDPACR